MDCNNKRVAELKALARERILKGYSWLRKAELIALLQNDLQPPRTPAPRTRPPRPTRGPWPPTPWRLHPHLHGKPEGPRNWKCNRLGLGQIGQDNLNL